VLIRVILVASCRSVFNRRLVPRRTAVSLSFALSTSCERVNRLIQHGMSLALGSSTGAPYERS
jgi:hypothetical protein